METVYRTPHDSRSIDELLLALLASDGERDAIADVAGRLGSDPQEHPAAIEFVHTWGISQAWLGYRPEFSAIERGTVLGVGTFITIKRESWYSDTITMRCRAGTDTLFCVPRWCYRRLQEAPGIRCA